MITPPTGPTVMDRIRANWRVWSIFTFVLTMGIGLVACTGCRQRGDYSADMSTPALPQQPNPLSTATSPEQVFPAASPNTVVDDWGPLVQDPPITPPSSVSPPVSSTVPSNAPAPASLPPQPPAPQIVYVPVYNTNPPTILRQTNNRVHLVYTNGPASTPIQAGQVTVNLPPPSGGPLVASGGYLQVAGHDNFIGWHPGMNPSGQQLTPSGPVPGTAGHFQKVSVGQSFALNKGQIAVIDFPNGNNPPCKINAVGGKARILYDGLTEQEMLQQSGTLHGAQRMTVENTVDEVLLARTE